MQGLHLHASAAGRRTSSQCSVASPGHRLLSSAASMQQCAGHAGGREQTNGLCPCCAYLRLRTAECLELSRCVGREPQRTMPVQCVGVCVAQRGRHNLGPGDETHQNT